MLKRWKVERQESVPEREAGLPAELLQAVKNLVEKMQTDVQQQLVLARAEHQAALQAAAELAERRDDENRALRDANAVLSTELAQTAELLVALRADHQRINLVMAALQSDNGGLQHRLNDRATEITGLNQQLTQSRAQFDHYQEATASQRAQERQASEQRIAQLENTLAGAQQCLMAQQATIGKQEAQVAHLSADKTRFTKVCDATQKAADALRAERDQLVHQITDLGTANQKQIQRLEITQQVLMETRLTLAGQEKEVQLLTAHLHKTEEKVAQLELERLSLTKERADLQRQVRHQGENR